MVTMITKFKFIRKKSEILNAGHGLMQYYPLLSPCSHSVEQAKERKFTIFTQTTMQLVYPPNLHNHYLEYFSWDDCNIYPGETGNNGFTKFWGQQRWTMVLI